MEIRLINLDLSTARLEEIKSVNADLMDRSSAGRRSTEVGWTVTLIDRKLVDPEILGVYTPGY